MKILIVVAVVYMVLVYLFIRGATKDDHNKDER